MRNGVSPDSYDPGGGRRNGKWAEAGQGYGLGYLVGRDAELVPKRLKMGHFASGRPSRPPPKPHRRAPDDIAIAVGVVDAILAEFAQ